MNEKFGKRAADAEAVDQAASVDAGRKTAASMSRLPTDDAVAHGFFRGLESADGVREKAIIAGQGVRDTCRWLAEELRRSFAALPELSEFSVLGKERCVYVIYQNQAIIAASVWRPANPDKSSSLMPCSLRFDDYWLPHIRMLLDPRGEGDWNTVFHAIGEYCAWKKTGVVFQPKSIEIKDDQ
jgi:hypothetical protein